MAYKFDSNDAGDCCMLYGRTCITNTCWVCRVNLVTAATCGGVIFSLPFVCLLVCSLAGKLKKLLVDSDENFYVIGRSWTRGELVKFRSDLEYIVDILSYL